MKKWICVLLAVLLLLLTGCDSQDYEQAQALYQAGDYAAAAEVFEALGDYEDSSQMAMACKYALAQEQYEAGEYTAASREFALLGDYEDSPQMVTACQYALAEELYEAGELLAAEASFRTLGDYRDSPDWVLRCRYEQGRALLEAGDYPAALEIFGSLTGFEDAAAQLQQAQWLQLQAFLIGQPPYVTEDGCCVGITAADPDQLTLWAEKTMDLGFYVVVDRCAISFTLGETEGRYELQTQTRTEADGLTGRTSCSAGGTILLAELTADTQLPLSDFYYYGQDVYGNVTERTEPWLGERERFAEIRGMLAVMLEHVPVLLEQSGSGYTLHALGLTGAE